MGQTRHKSFNYQIAFSVCEYQTKEEGLAHPRGEGPGFDKIQDGLTVSHLRQTGLTWLIDEMQILTTDELVTNDVLLTEFEFSEFDSPNWVHATGYYDVSVYCADFGFAKELQMRFENFMNT